MSPARLAATVAVIALTTLPALADSTARATADLPLYAGPGRGYPVVGTLPKGEPVHLERCTRLGRWCLVVRKGQDGWVLGSYLVGSAAKVEATPPTFEGFDFAPF